MYPNPIPENPGCLSVLVHAGSVRPTMDCITLKDGSKLAVPSVGTRDPDVWCHVLWFKGRAYTATLKCDLLSHRPQFEELCEHFDMHPDFWAPIMPVAQT